MGEVPLMPRLRALHLTAIDVSRRLSAAGFTRHVPAAPGMGVIGAAGFDVSESERGAGVDVYDMDRHGDIRDPGPLMLAWGRHLVACGYRVVVAERTHLLVTLPEGAEAGAPHAVERAA